VHTRTGWNVNCRAKTDDDKHSTSSTHDEYNQNGALQFATGSSAPPPAVQVGAGPPVMVGNRTGQRLWFPNTMVALGGDARVVMLRAQTTSDLDNASDAVFISRDLGTSWRHFSDEPVQKRMCTPYPLELVGGDNDATSADLCIPYEFAPRNGSTTATRLGSVWVTFANGSVASPLTDSVPVHVQTPPIPHSVVPGVPALPQPMHVSANAIPGLSTAVMLTPLYFEGAGQGTKQAQIGPQYLMMYESVRPHTNWTIRSRITPLYTGAGGGEIGTESNICRLPDGRIIIVFRSWKSYALNTPLAISASSTDGYNWTRPEYMRGHNSDPHSVFPILLLLPTNVLALSSGRTGTLIWTLPVADLLPGKEASALWFGFSLLAHHNAAVTAGQLPSEWLYPANCANASHPEHTCPPICDCFTTSYTSMALLPYDAGSTSVSLLIAYDHTWVMGDPWAAPPIGKYDTIFTTRVTITTASPPLPPLPSTPPTPPPPPTPLPPPTPPPPPTPHPPFYIDPMTVHVVENRRAPFPSSKQQIDLAAQRGECERAQLWFWYDLAYLYDVSITFTDLKAVSSDVTLPAGIWSYKQQGYVQANSSWMYTCNYDVLTDDANWTNHPCHSGWYPDALFDVPSSGIPVIKKGVTQPIFLEVCIPYGTTAGNYSGEFQLAGNGISYSIPVDIEVWDIDLPRTNSSSAFGTAFSWGSTGQWEMEKWYGPQSPQRQNMSNDEIWQAWYPFLFKHRIPGDDLYNQAPRPTEEMVYRADTGSRFMNLMNAAYWSGQGLTAYNESYSKDMTAMILALLEPTITNLTALGHFDKLFAYGFDEFCDGNLRLHPKSGCPGNQTIYDLFGALQAKWPGLKTMATLQWPSLPSDLPVTIWVDEVMDFYDGEVDPSKWPASYKTPSKKEKARQAFLASGKDKEFWWYCE
jgi:hypothetical protein